MTPDHSKSCAENWEEAFDKEFKCINSDCDSNGSISVMGANGEQEQEQCQFCFEYRFKIKDFIRRLLSQSSCTHYIPKRLQDKCKICREN